MTPQDARQAAVLGDVTGMGSGDRGYAYAPTASLGRVGDVQSDASDVNGISPKIGGAVTDTALQMRYAIARRPQLMKLFRRRRRCSTGNLHQSGPTAPATPLTAATAGSPHEAAGNRPIVMPDVKPMPAGPAAAPGVQTAQAYRRGRATTAPRHPTNAPPDMPDAQTSQPLPAAPAAGVFDKPEACCRRPR